MTVKVILVFLKMMGKDKYNDAAKKIYARAKAGKKLAQRAVAAAVASGKKAQQVYDQTMKQMELLCEGP